MYKFLSKVLPSSLIDTLILPSASSPTFAFCDLDDDVLCLIVRLSPDPRVFCNLNRRFSQLFFTLFPQLRVFSNNCASLLLAISRRSSSVATLTLNYLTADIWELICQDCPQLTSLSLLRAPPPSDSSFEKTILGYTCTTLQTVQVCNGHPLHFLSRCPSITDLTITDYKARFSPLMWSSSVFPRLQKFVLEQASSLADGPAPQSFDGEDTTALSEFLHGYCERELRHVRLVVDFSLTRQFMAVIAQLAPQMHILSAAPLYFAPPSVFALSKHERLQFTSSLVTLPSNIAHICTVMLQDYDYQFITTSVPWEQFSSLTECQIEGLPGVEELTCLSRCPSLTKLDLTMAHPDTLLLLARFPVLKELTVKHEETSFDSEWVETACPLTIVEHLSILRRERADLMEVVSLPMSLFPNLSSLTLMDNSRFDFSMLLPCPRVRSLSIKQCSPFSLSQVARFCPLLESFTCTSDKIGNTVTPISTVVQHFKPLCYLRSFRMDNISLTKDDMLEFFDSFPSLHTFGVRFSTLTDEALEAIAEKGQFLRSITLDRCLEMSVQAQVDLIHRLESACLQEYVGTYAYGSGSRLKNAPSIVKISGTSDKNLAYQFSSRRRPL